MHVAPSRKVLRASFPLGARRDSRSAGLNMKDQFKSRKHGRTKPPKRKKMKKPHKPTMQHERENIQGGLEIQKLEI